MRYAEIRAYHKLATRRVRAGNINQCATGDQLPVHNVVIDLTNQPEPKFRHWAEKRLSDGVIRRRRYS